MLFRSYFKEESGEDCLRVREREGDGGGGGDFVPDHRSDVLKGSLPKDPSPHPGKAKDPSIRGRETDGDGDGGHPFGYREKMTNRQTERKTKQTQINR